ncbi:protein SRG1 [Sesamum alatum]|uniref:Protein SRG1 n=1 Tax=Sesamum alatum TaxID=300844 RepID=A0AAE1YL72_9LAMI|nr:protein SRG1 [Sesamum alatum]
MSEVSSTPKPVQELVENGDELPQRYIWRDNGDYGAIDFSVPLATEIPVIDFSLLVSSKSAMDPELLKLRSALSSWGCFQAVNHGIEISLVDQVRKLSREFFHLPKGEKQKYARPTDDFEGYGNDTVMFENQPLDWVDRDMLYDYTAKVREIEEQLLKAMARSLSLPEDSFVIQFGEQPSISARFNYYPPCARPDAVVGLKPHTDGLGITILLQDEQVEGLQLLKDNQWFRIPIMPHALVVNLGDQLEIMSNGIFKSPVHRALTNPTRERNTLAMFCTPDPAQEIGPVEELINDKRPRAFKNIKNYAASYFYYYQQGKSPIDAVRV